MSANGRGTCTFVAETHAYAIDGKPAISVTQVVEATFPAEYPSVPIAMRNREYAGERGRAGHIACDLIDQGLLDWHHLREKAIPVVPIAEGWQRFRETEPFQPDGPWQYDANGEASPLVEDQRIITFEERAWWKPLLLAGTLDRRGSWSHRGYHIVDVKTEKSRKLPWTHAVQLAGYAMLYLLVEGVPLGKPLQNAFADIGRTVVQLGRERPARDCICSGCRSRAGYHVVSYDDPEDLDTFVAAITIARAKAAHA